MVGNVPGGYNVYPPELADCKQPVAFTVESELPRTTPGNIGRQAIIESYELDPV